MAEAAKPARLIFWTAPGKAVWLKAETSPEALSSLCREGRCPCVLFGCPLGRDGACAGTSAKDWRRFFAGKSRGRSSGA